MINAQEVRDLRELTGLGLQQCKDILLREALHDVVDQAQTVEDLKPVLKELLDKAFTARRSVCDPGGTKC